MEWAGSSGAAGLDAALWRRGRDWTSFVDMSAPSLVTSGCGINYHQSVVEYPVENARETLNH